MKTKLLLLLLTLSFIITPEVFAKRLGSGRSYGMQRSQSYQNYNGPSHYTYNPGNPANPTTVNSGYSQQRQGMGAGTAAALGAAAGAAGGYMLGRSMNNDGTSNHPYSSGVEASRQQDYTNNNLTNHIPWGIIIVLTLILGFGLLLFRKNKTAPQMNAAPGFFGANNNSFQQNIVQPVVRAERKPVDATSSSSSIIINAKEAKTLDKLPDGVETIYFLRQVKGMFLHVQSMNNAENINEISKYMTPDLYTELADEIKKNNALADFSNLDLQLLGCSLEDNVLTASVRFFGMVSEDPETAPVSFNETWNFVKSDATSNKWLIAGIQQDKQ